MNDRASLPLEADTDVVMTGAPGLLDLSRQQRNILLFRPLFQLERYKANLADEGGTDRTLFDGIDTHYLVLSALDHMMESTTVSMGSTAPEVLDFLASIAVRMKPILSPAQSQRIANLVLDALDNRANKQREFNAEYFDARSGVTKTFRFRLVRFQPDPSDVHRYSPTSEGYLVYLGMLDMSPEDSQELMEKMLDLLVKRGRFDKALDIAQRARKLSLEYRQLIREKLYQAYRAPGTVNWSKDMAGNLDGARAHVTQRQAQDFRMEQAVAEALDEANELHTRENLVQLLETLKGAGLIRMKLVTDINASPEQFIAAQGSVFRARKPTGLPDLESRLFPQLINLPARTLVQEADRFLSALYPSAWPKVYDLNTVFNLLMERRGEDAVPDADEGEIKAFEPIPDQFTKALVDSTNDWLAAKFATGATFRVDELLQLAQSDGLGVSATLCLAFILYRSFADSETEFKEMTARLTGLNFLHELVQGNNIEFAPRGLMP
jgi:hypothetical protein